MDTPSRRAAAADSAAAAAARVPTVHVHIDRIEVRLAEPPAPPKPAARKPAAPSALDRYLAQRRGGR